MSTLLAFLARWSWRLGRKIATFFDDWNGEAARPAAGVPARPGVMLRLQGVEELVAEVAKEITLNGGGSMHDVVVTTAKDVAQVQTDLTKMAVQVEENSVIVRQIQLTQENGDG